MDPTVSCSERRVHERYVQTTFHPVGVKRLHYAHFGLGQSASA